jgi:hypothetical protein
MVELAVMEIRNEMSEPHAIAGDATFTTPRIVNGLTVRPREKVNVWRILGISVASVFGLDVVALLAIAIFGVRRIPKYLDSRGKLVGRPDVLK